MPDSSRFIGRVGLDEDFYEPDKIVHYAVEAPIERVSTALVSAESFFLPCLNRDDGLRLAKDMFGKARGNKWPCLKIFQLWGQTWTQLATHLDAVRGLALGRYLSRDLDTRCICIEVTDDAYSSCALFDRGTTEQISLHATNLDMKPMLSELGLEVPAEFKELDRDDDWDKLDEAFYSYRLDGSPARDDSELVSQAGCFLKTPWDSEGPSHGLSDLRAEDLVRLDLLWIEST